MTGDVNLLRDKRGIRDFRIRHTGFFFILTYIVKMAGTTDIPHKVIETVSHLHLID